MELVGDAVCRPNTLQDASLVKYLSPEDEYAEKIKTKKKIKNNIKIIKT